MGKCMRKRSGKRIFVNGRTLIWVQWGTVCVQHWWEWQDIDQDRTATSFKNTPSLNAFILWSQIGQNVEPRKPKRKL